MMNLRIAIIISIFFLIIGAVACGGGPEANTNASNANTNKANASNLPQNSAVAVTTPTPAQTANNAPTVASVAKAYCTAMEKRDEAAIRKIYSSDSIKDFEEQMKEEGSKSLIDHLRSTDKVSSALCEVRNEVVTGDTIVAELKTESMPNGAQVVFVKEGGEWKLTNRSPELNSVKETAPANKSAK